MAPRNRTVALFARRRPLLAFFMRRARRPADAADLLQETYLRILRQPSASIEDPESYLIAVASNLVRENALATARRESHETLTDPHAFPDVPVPSDYADEAHADALKSRLSRVVLQMPARYQLVLRMTYEENLSQNDIAKKLNVSRSMVQKVLAKAVNHCRSRLMSEMHEAGRLSLPRKSRRNEP